MSEAEKGDGYYMPGIGDSDGMRPFKRFYGMSNQSAKTDEL